MFGKEKIMSMLTTNLDVTDKLDKFTDQNNTSRFAIWSDSKLPHNNALNRTINFYRIKGIDGGMEYGEYIYRFACRGNSFGLSEELGVAVFNTFNRYSTGKWYFKCELGTVIPPKDENDNHNCTLDVKIYEQTSY